MIYNLHQEIKFMNQSNKKSTKKTKSKKRSCCNNKNSNSSNSSNKESSSSNNSNTQSNSNQNTSSKLCYFSAIDYIVLASTLAIALGEELSTTDISILSTFFAVLSDELALIGGLDACNNNDEDVIFVPPIPDVAATSSRNKNKKCTKKRK